LNKEEGVDLQITGFDEHGFFINEKMYVLGPCILFKKAIFSWNISGLSEVNKNSLSLFAMLEPKLGIFLFN
jgi:NADH dehydrogenase [ubiquinone] 1 alpha subcomplex assembly factor 3